MLPEQKKLQAIGQYLHTLLAFNTENLDSFSVYYRLTSDFFYIKVTHRGSGIEKGIDRCAGISEIKLGYNFESFAKSFGEKTVKELLSEPKLVTPDVIPDFIKMGYDLAFADWGDDWRKNPDNPEVSDYLLQVYAVKEPGINHYEIDYQISFEG